MMIEAIGTACTIGFEDDMNESIMMNTTISDDTFRMALDKALKRKKLSHKERAKKIGEYLVCTPIDERDEVIDKVEKEAADYEQEKRKSKECPLEDVEQKDFVHRFRHTYPGVILANVRNDGTRTFAERPAQLLMGVYPGFSDLICLDFQICIEMKRRDEKKSSPWSDEQQDFKRKVELLGWHYILAYGADDGMEKVAPIIERKLRELTCYDESLLLSK